jgi:hypothetical protein
MGSRGLAASLFAVFAMALAAGPAACQATLSLETETAGGWLLSVTGTDISDGPGGDVTGSYESRAGNQTLTVSGTSGPTDPWTVSVRRSDSAWDSDLILEARVSSSGSGNGAIEASGAYRVVTQTYQDFFSGTGDRENVTVQLRLSGISTAAIAAGSYITQTLYAFVEGE